MNAAEHIEWQKEHRTYYKKVGRKYLPLTEFETAGLMEGFYLVEKKPGCTSYYAQVRPAFAEIDAAIKRRSDQMVKILDQHMKARPHHKLTKKQLADWEALNEKHPEMFRFLEYKALQDIAGDFIKEITGKEDCKL